MAEKIISPGVFTKEVDQTFLPAAIGEIGAAIIGPTVKGPALVPTVVSSFGEFQQRFGDSFQSGSNYYQYLTSHTAEQYLKHSGQLTVVRILDGTFSPAEASVATSGSTVGSTFASGSYSFTKNPTGSLDPGGADEFRLGDVSFVFVSSSAGLEDSTTQRFVNFGTGTADQSHATASLVNNLVTAVNAATIAGILNITASRKGVTTNINGVLSLTGSGAGTTNNLTVTTGSGADNTATTLNFVKSVATNLTTQITTFNLQGGTDSTTSGTAFKLFTLDDGAIMNNSGSSGVHTSTLLIRRGDDNTKRKQILETFNNVSLDPNTNNYIGKIVGDSKLTIRDSGTTDPYLQLSGSYPNKSKYVRVANVQNTVDYLDENGNVRLDSQSGSLPGNGSGSYAGAFENGANGYAGFDALGNPSGTNTTTYNFYEKITSTDSQGFNPGVAAQGKTAYEDALNLLNNQDEYDVNMILVPGLNQQNHSTIITKAIDICEDRGDCFVVADPVPYGSTLTQATTEAEDYDSNFAAMYWPWIQIPDNQVGTPRWVPPSVVIPGIYAFNDKVAHPWFAPAGLNRGGIDVAIQAERKLTHANRDSLYDANVNPIATFPGQGVCAWGQKTLQKKASALDRINVRRLMIRVKKFIASTSRFLVFEQNNTATRNRFLNIVNPYLEQVQSNSGLNAFRVVMDDTNNTADIVDRNILYGQIFLQPTRTAEFIVLDFTLQPTGATFPE